MSEARPARLLPVVGQFHLVARPEMVAAPRRRFHRRCAGDGLCEDLHAQSHIQEDGPVVALNRIQRNLVKAYRTDTSGGWGIYWASDAGVRAGSSFEWALDKELLPPPGPTFVNRVIRSGPIDPEPWGDIRSQATPEAVKSGLSELVEVLAGFANRGANLPKMLAAEHAITGNLYGHMLF